jgi:hypothetical protein
LVGAWYAVILQASLLPVMVDARNSLSKRAYFPCHAPERAWTPNLIHRHWF